jgi:hypothetical protein
MRNATSEDVARPHRGVDAILESAPSRGFSGDSAARLRALIEALPDFNNLLTTMLRYARLADAELHPDSPARIYIQAIEQAGGRAVELCQQMLAHAGESAEVKNHESHE